MSADTRSWFPRASGPSAPITDQLGSRQPRAGCRSRLLGPFASPFLTLPAGCSLLIAAVAVLGAVHILVRTSTHGAAVEWDSVAYLTAAESLAAGDGLRRPGFGVMFVQWPPLFPMLLALLVPFGLEAVVKLSDGSIFRRTGRDGARVTAVTEPSESVEWTASRR